MAVVIYLAGGEGGGGGGDFLAGSWSEFLVIRLYI
jgi:hypothetical protein